MTAPTHVDWAYGSLPELTLSPQTETADAASRVRPPDTGCQREREIGKRRRWSLAEKLAVVAEASAPSTNLSAVARRHGISPTQLFRWRKSLDIGTSNKPSLLGDSGVDQPQPQTIIEIQLANGRQVRVSQLIDADTLARIIKAIDT